ncbi:hypothetical protein [Vibrio bivalvicida]|uniref:Uncharacterized protein n=1 Tax=Vibrio bivalvicida TaxID=1276888 RepID=A0ABV4MMB8_9VIBR
MMRKIEFIAHSRALSLCLSSAFGGVAIILIMDFVLSRVTL